MAFLIREYEIIRQDNAAVPDTLGSYGLCHQRIEFSTIDPFDFLPIWDSVMVEVKVIQDHHGIFP